MRTKKALINSIISVIVQGLTLILSFLNRRIFVYFLDIQMLGYESLFTNVFSLLSMADMGIGNIITYNLYRELASDNKKEIKKLMAMYKFMFRMVAIVIAVVGSLLIFFLPAIIKDDVDDWNFVNKIYILQLLGVVASYFLSYRRTIFIADQKDYKCTIVDLIGRISLQVGQIIVLALTKNFLLYLSVKIIVNILINVVVYAMSNKEYPYIKEKIKVEKKDFQERRIFTDTRDFIVHKLATTVYNGTDNIVISAFLGVTAVAVYGNYYLIQNSVITLFVFKVLTPVRASVGNLIYSDGNIKKQRGLFDMFNLIGFILASTISICFLYLFQDFITIWMGSKYLLSFSFVIAISILAYAQIVSEILYTYRCSFGNYDIDRKYMILGALVNIGLTVLFVNWWGITGITIGTIIGLLFIVYGRFKAVFNKLDFLSPKNYLKNQGIFFALWVLECLITGVAVVRIEGTSIGWFILKGIVCFTVPNLLSFIFFNRNSAMVSLKEYLLDFLKSKRGEDEQ